MSNDAAALGKKGEELAVKFLKKKGFKILQRNYRCRCGEIDIIARDGEYLAFIEVKTRSSTVFGAPAMAVNSRKQLQIGKSAQYYLTENQLHDIPARFDVVAILSTAAGPQIDFIRNAFELY